MGVSCAEGVMKSNGTTLTSGPRLPMHRPSMDETGTGTHFSRAVRIN